MCAVAACEPPGSIVLFLFLIKETFLSFNVGRGTDGKEQNGSGEVGSVSHKLIEEDVFDSLDTFFKKKIKQIKPKKKKHMARMYV